MQAVTSPYSSGVNEGRITDVKLQKRLMVGRAQVPLLRQRLVLIARLRRHATPWSGVDELDSGRAAMTGLSATLAATTGHHGRSRDSAWWAALRSGPRSICGRSGCGH